VLLTGTRGLPAHATATATWLVPERSPQQKRGNAMTLTMECATRRTISLLDGEMVEESDLGSIRRVTAGNFPIPFASSAPLIVIRRNPVDEHGIGEE
jgi:hypothetical protein